MRGAFWSFIVAFFIATFCVAPFLQYQDAKTESMGKVQHDVPYETLEANYKKEKSRTDQEHANWMETTTLFQKTYSKTNIWVSSVAIQQAGEEINRMWAKVIPSDPHDRLFVKSRLQQTAAKGVMDNLASVAATQESLHKVFDRAYPIYATTISRFLALLVAAPKKCSGGISTEAIPTYDEIFNNIKNSEGTGRRTEIILGTNCIWRGSYQLGLKAESAWLYLTCSSSNYPPMNLAIDSRDEQLGITLESAGITLISTNCAPAPTTDCLKIIDDAIHIIINIQGDDF
jgi:hypothetical protein